MSINRSRVPAGLTTGGQFAAEHHPASTVTLTQAADRPQVGPPEAGDDEEQVRRVMDHTRTAARFAQRRTGQEADDVAGDALLAMVEANRRGRAWAVMSRGEINTIVPRIAYRKVSGLRNGESFEGLRRYRREITRIEQEQSRVVGRAEADRIAEQVRMSMPPKRRPTIGYHRPGRDKTDVRLDHQPTDAPLGVDVDYLSAADDSDEIRQTAFEYQLAEVQQARREEGRWAAMTILRPAPMPRPGQLTPEEATVLRRRIAAMGGARAVTLSWREGRASVHAAAAYFAAFGDLDDTERDQVAETFMLAGTAENTDQVFSEVVSAATRKRVRNR